MASLEVLATISKTWFFNLLDWTILLMSWKFTRNIDAVTIKELSFHFYPCWKFCPKRRRRLGNLKTIVYLQCFLWKWVSHIFRLSLSIRPDNRAWGKCWTWWVSLTLSNFHHFLSKILGIEQHSRVQSWFQEVLPGKPTPANSNFLMPAHKKTTGCERGKWRGSNFFFQVGLIKLVSFLFHFD